MTVDGDPRMLSGILAACLTPFDEAGRLDLSALERQIDFVTDHADAVSIGAVEASEYSVLDPGTREQLIVEGTRMVAGRLPVVAGVSSPDLAAMAALASAAANAGADAVQVLAPRRPWGGEPDPGELIDLFERVQAASPLPIVAYHNPACGADPQIDTWVEVCRLPGIVALKESSRDVSKIGQMIERIAAPGHASYFTTMQPLLHTLLLGGSGGTMPPPATAIGARVLAALAAGDIEGARSWQRVFNTFPARWSRHGLPPVMKAAMRQIGVDIGNPLPPFAGLSGADANEIGSLLRGTGAFDPNSGPGQSAQEL